MGIIQRQSIQSTVVILIGFGIGAINMLFLYPRALSPVELGLTRVITDAGLTLATLGSLGTLPIIYKFSPFYHDYLPKKKNDLPLLTGIACIIGFILVCAAGYYFRDVVVRKFSERSKLFVDYAYLVYPYTACLLFFMWMEGFSWSLKRGVQSNALKETAVRVLNTVLVLGLLLGFINFNGFIHGFGIIFLLPAIALFILLRRSGDFTFNRPYSNVSQRLGKRMVSFGLYVFGAQFLNLLSRVFDTFVLSSKSAGGLADAGIFTIATYVVTLMEVPQRSITSSTVAVLAENWKKKDMANISDIYHKSVSSLLIVGLLMFGLLWLNVHNITKILGQDYAAVESIVLFMGIGKLIDLGTGVNGQIIGTSNYWRVDFFTNVVYTLIALPLNYILISKLGLMGAAYSSVIALTVYNLIRYLFIYKKFGLQPYSFKHLKLVGIAILAFAAVYFIPRLENWLLDSLLRSAIFCIVFLPLTYKAQISSDINLLMEKYYRKIFR